MSAILPQKNSEDGFEGLKADLGVYLSPEAVAQIVKAYELSKKAHEGQFRRSGEPYITHPVAVARILANLHMDADTVMAALLHDVIEDTFIDKKTLAHEISSSVADLVDGVSKLSQIGSKSKKEIQAESFRKMVLAMSRDIRVIIIKLADRLHNLRTIEHMPQEKKRRIGIESMEIYAPIANRLGMNQFCVEYEDRSFAAIYPWRTQVLRRAVRDARDSRATKVTTIENAIQNTLAKTLIDAEVFHRESHLYSIYKKMKHQSMRFGDLMDWMTFSLIVPTVNDCYRAMGALHNLYKPMPGRFKDYIAIPKANGYQSLHTVLFGPYGAPVRIQIRTDEMQFAADYGIASFYRQDYSAQQATSAASSQAENFVSGLVEIGTDCSSVDFIQHAKEELFPDEIYVFSPQGKIFALPRGATPIDFAYAIHTDIGHSCIAARVDKVLTPLSAELGSGQTVEMITGKKINPQLSWLNFVATGKARSKIKQFLNKRKKNEAITMGKRLLEKALKVKQMDLNTLAEADFDEAIVQFKVRSFNHLVREIGKGNRSALAVARFMAENKGSESDFSSLAVDGADGMVQYATCCYPVPGDAIVGVIQKGKGVVIHGDWCQEAQNKRRDPDLALDVSWSDTKEQKFKALLSVILINEPGVLGDIAGLFGMLDVNIESIMTEQIEEGSTSCRFLVKLQDLDGLHLLLKHLRKHPHVLKAERLKDFKRLS